MVGWRTRPIRNPICLLVIDGGNLSVTTLECELSQWQNVHRAKAASRPKQCNMKPPRFTLRFLLVVVTIAAMGFGVSRRFCLKRPVTERETEDVESGLLHWQVRWRLGAPHHTFDSPCMESWGYDYADSEEAPLTYFNVTFDKATGRVVSAERQTSLDLDPLAAPPAVLPIAR